jgi:hypothetical protein
MSLEQPSPPNPKPLLFTLEITINIVAFEAKAFKI